jgi:hypothetical protein
LPLIVVFHLARLMAGLILLLTAFRFVALVTPHPHERRLAFVLLFSASGLGWLGAIFDAFPIDLWVPEAFVPYSLYANPHFPLAMALMLVILQLVAWPARFKEQESEDQASSLLPTPSNARRSHSLLPTPYLLGWTGCFGSGPHSTFRPSHGLGHFGRILGLALRHPSPFALAADLAYTWRHSFFGPDCFLRLLGFDDQSHLG